MASSGFSRRVLRSPRQDNQAKEVGSELFGFLIDTVEEVLDVDHFDADGFLLGPLSTLADSVDALGPKSLWDELSPAEECHEIPTGVTVSTAVADSERSGQNGQSYAATNAADDGMSSCWCSEASRRSSTWTVRLDAPAVVTSVQLAWRSLDQKACAPATLTVEVSDDGTVFTPAETVTIADALPKAAFSTAATPPASAFRHRVLVGMPAYYIRLRMEGTCTNNPSGFHALGTFVANVEDKEAVHTPTKQTLENLRRLLHKSVLTPGLSSLTHQTALRGIQGLTLASGALAPLLSLTEVLLSAKSPVDAAATAQLTSFVDRLRGVAGKEVEGMLTGAVEALKAELDPGCKSGYFNLSEDNTVATSSNSSKNYVYGTVGFKSGTAAWEFTSTRDAHGDECLTFGCGTKPVSSGSYDSSSNLWTIRCYNGTVYTPGNSRGSARKIHQGDIVRFELDCEAGTVTCKVNDEDLGIVFRGLEGKEVFPAICSYGDRRVAKFLSIEAAGSGGGGVSMLASMEETQSEGHFYKNGKLGADKNIMVDGSQAAAAAMSLIPFASTKEPSVVTYAAGEAGAEALVGVVTVDDTTPAGAQPVVFEVLAEDKETVLYASPPVSTPGESHFFRVFFPDGPASAGDEFTLRARLQDTSSDDGASTPVASLVLLETRLVHPRDWSWLKRSPGTFQTLPSSPDTAQVAGALLDAVDELAGAHMQNMASGAVAASRVAQAQAVDDKPDGADVAQAEALRVLENPFCIDVSAQTFVQLETLLRLVLPRVQEETAAGGAGASASASASAASSGDNLPTFQAIARTLLSLVKANLRRLVLSNIDPATVGIHYGQPGDDAPLTLNPLHRTLQSIMDAGDAIPKSLQIAAADAVDSGLSILYPTPTERRELLTSLISKGGVIEVQFKFPTFKLVDVKKKAKKDGEKDEPAPERDLRFDRALVLLQVECEARGFTFQLTGSWNNHVHLVVDLPESDTGGAVDLLDNGFATAFSRAGFSSWTIPIGCADPLVSLKIERYASFDAARNFAEDGMGVVRMYPRSAGSFTDILAGIKSTSPDTGADAGAGAGAGAGSA